MRCERDASGEPLHIGAEKLGRDSVGRASWEFTRMATEETRLELRTDAVKSKDSAASFLLAAVAHSEMPGVKIHGGSRAAARLTDRSCSPGLVTFWASSTSSPQPYRSQIHGTSKRLIQTCLRDGTVDASGPMAASVPPMSSGHYRILKLCSTTSRELASFSW
jgi:hypothetical protein